MTDQQHQYRLSRLCTPVAMVAASLALSFASPVQALLRAQSPGSAKSASVADRHTARAGGGARPDSTPRVANEFGRIPILEWHQVVDADGSYKVSRTRFADELAELHRRGYVPIGLDELLDRRIDIPAGKSPVLFTFDDASPSQFRYIERNGALVVDPTSAVGILLDFVKAHPEWRRRGVFCVLSAADAGHALFGNKGIDGQQTAWRFPKLQFLVAQGFELCGHTQWHAKLNKFSDDGVQEQIARGNMAIDSAVAGYRVRGFALPYGLWPKNRALAVAGSWKNPKNQRVISYAHDAVFEVAGGPARSPYDSLFNARKLPRVPLQGGTRLSTTLDLMDKPGPMARYVSDGNPKTVAKSPVAVSRRD